MDATLALFVALGGGAYAAGVLPKNSVGAKQIKKNAVRASEIKKAAVRSGEVKNKTLLSDDFKFPPYSQAEADSLFLGKGGKAADSEQVDGVDSSELARRSDIVKFVVAPTEWRESIASVTSTAATGPPSSARPDRPAAT